MEALVKGYHQLQRNKRLLCTQKSRFYYVQLIIGALLSSGLLLVFIYFERGSINTLSQLMALVSVFLLITIHRVLGVYQRSGSIEAGCFRLLRAWGLFLSLFVGLELIISTGQVSLQVFVFWAAFGLLAQWATFAISSWGVVKLREYADETIPCIIVGNGRLGRHLEEKVNSNRWLPDEILGFVSCQDFQCYGEDEEKAPCLGDLDSIRNVIIEYDIKRIYIAMPLEHSQKVEKLHLELLSMNIDLIWVPDIFALQLLNHSVREVAGLPLICLNESPITSTRSGIFFKSLLDKVAAFIALVLISPLMVGIAAIIKFTSKGPVFFKQERHGWNGSVFEIYKLRSMTVHDDHGDVKQATRTDSRITPIGRFIRRSSIDELPQLFNVLLGNMSLVGPRPHAVAHNNYYDSKINTYLARHRIKPGITGLAQVNGFRGETETVDKMLHRVEYDVQYINNWSLWLDVKILIKTPLSLFSKDIY